MTKDLVNYFESYLEKESIFKNKKALQTEFIPTTLDHRSEITNKLAEILAPCLRLDKPSNIFLYGKTGTGKTVTIHFVMEKLKEVAKTKNIAVKFLYINCKLKKVADTEYRVVAEMIRKMGGEIPATGLPTEEVYKHFLKLVDYKEQIIILILDEIDQLIEKTGDEILYSLTRIGSELKQAQISFVGISNDLVFVNYLDPRIKSSLSEEEIIFHPYNAMQLKDILHNRSKLAFKENSITEGVVEKCSAYAAREHGDARRALELLRAAGEICERKGLNTVILEHIDEAEEKIERDRILDSIIVQPAQFHLVLYSIFTLFKQKNDFMHTGEVYDLYKSFCNKTNTRPLTQRRVSDIINELDMLGIINAKTVSKGRYGRTRDIILSLPDDLFKNINELLEQKLNL